MLGQIYSEIEHEEEFDTIEEAILTSCHICGTELEWSLTVKWSETKELPEIFGSSFSCGIKFFIIPTENGYMTTIHKD